MEEDVIDSNTCDPPPPVEVNSYDRPPSVPPPSVLPPSAPPTSAPPPSAPLPSAPPPSAPPPSAPPSSAPFPSAPPPSTSITSAPPPSAPLPSASPPSAPPPSTPPPSATPLPGTPPSAPPPSAPSPLAPPSPLSVEVPIYSPFDEPPPYKPLEAAPVYKLQSDYVLAKVAQQPRMSHRTVNPRDERDKKLGSSWNKWFIIYGLVIMMGVFLLWTIPCCIGVVVAFAWAGGKLDDRQYEEYKKWMRVANCCFALWILSAMVGAVLIITLSLVL